MPSQSWEEKGMFELPICRWRIYIKKAPVSSSQPPNDIPVCERTSRSAIWSAQGTGKHHTSPLVMAATDSSSSRFQIEDGDEGGAVYFGYSFGKQQSNDKSSWVRYSECAEEVWNVKIVWVVSGEPQGLFWQYRDKSRAEVHAKRMLILHTAFFWQAPFS